MINRILFIVTITFILCSIVHGQPSKEEFAAVSKEISEIRPGIKKEVLNEDRIRIKTKYELIYNEYKTAGFTAEDTKRAVLVGWSYVRTESPLQDYKSIDSASFFTFMTTQFRDRNGKVMFTSDPEAADIIVNDEFLGQSEQSRWYSVDSTVKVTCKKNGFTDGSNICNVSIGNNICPCKLK